MSRTFRKQRPEMRLGESLAHKRTKNGNVRDGTQTHFSPSCEHNGGCPWCTGNRLHASERRTALDMDGDE